MNASIKIACVRACVRERACVMFVCRKLRKDRMRVNGVKTLSKAKGIGRVG